MSEDFILDDSYYHFKLLDQVIGIPRKVTGTIGNILNSMENHRLRSRILCIKVAGVQRRVR